MYYFWVKRFQNWTAISGNTDPAVQDQDVFRVCLQPVLHCSAHTEDLIQLWGQKVDPTCVQNLTDK